MKVAVKDANIFIDLESMGILDLWFQLGHETLTSTFIVDELELGGHEQALSCIRAGQAQVIVIAGEDMGSLMELWSEVEAHGASLGDASVLWLAIRAGAMLLTGDKPLRTQAAVRSIECHGTLWILDRLVEAGLLEPLSAANKLERLLRLVGRRRRRLPESECIRRITRWRRC